MGWRNTPPEQEVAKLPKQGGNAFEMRGLQDLPPLLPSSQTSLTPPMLQWPPALLAPLGTVGIKPQTLQMLSNAGDQ